MGENIGEFGKLMANHQSFLPQIYRRFNICILFVHHSPKFSPLYTAKFASVIYLLPVFFAIRYGYSTNNFLRLNYNLCFAASCKTSYLLCISYIPTYNYVKYVTGFAKIFPIDTTIEIQFVTEFAKGGLIHASDFPTLKSHNFICK